MIWWWCVTITLTGMAAIGAAIWQLRQDTQQVRADLTRFKEQTMAKFEDVQTLVGAINAETTRIADKLAALGRQVAEGGMTPDQEATVQLELGEIVTRLRGMGADPENPVISNADPVEPADLTGTK